MLLTEQLHNPKLLGWPFSNSEPAYSISLSVRALEFKHIQSGTIVFIVICTHFLPPLWKVRTEREFQLNDRRSMFKKDN